MESGNFIIKDESLKSKDKKVFRARKAVRNNIIDIRLLEQTIPLYPDNSEDEVREKELLKNTKKIFQQNLAKYELAVKELYDYCEGREGFYYLQRLEKRWTRNGSRYCSQLTYL